MTTEPETHKGDDRKQEQRRTSQSDLLVELVRLGGYLFHDANEEAYVTVAKDGRHRTMKLRSKAARGWMDHQFFTHFGKVAGGQAKADAIATLEGISLNEGPLRSVHVRTAEHGGCIYIDLGDESRDVVEVSADGWRVQPSPVCFLRPQGLIALPRPVRGGSVDDLRRFVNTGSEAYFRLVVAWVLAALRPRGPYPILCLQGEHGSAKSTTTRFLRRLVDPNVLPVRTVPRDTRDLAIAARNGHVLAFDNLSGLQPWLSDVLCQVSTGGGFATRVLCTDDEEILFNFVKPIVVNGIDDVATRSDFADRCLIATLAPIPTAKRRRELELFAHFEDAAPGIFGAFLSALSGAIAREPSVRLSELPRMADFATFVTAAEPALGWTEGEFAAAYASNQKDASAVAWDADLVAQVVARFMQDRTGWTGPAKELFEQLRPLVTDDERNNKLWPKAANILSGKLRRAAPILRDLGIDVEFNTCEGRGAEKRRQIQIRTRQQTSSIVPTVHSPDTSGKSAESSSVPESSPRAADRPHETDEQSRGRLEGSEPSPPVKRILPGGDDGDDGDDADHREEDDSFAQWLSQQGIKPRE